MKYTIWNIIQKFRRYSKIKNLDEEHSYTSSALDYKVLRDTLVWKLNEEKYGAVEFGIYDMVVGMNWTFNEVLSFLGGNYFKPIAELFTLSPCIYELVDIKLL